MKKNKFWVLGLLVLVFAFVGCSTTGSTDPEMILVGHVTDTARPATNFPIYQTVGVSNEQAMALVPIIQAGYSQLGDDYQDALTGRNIEIWIVPIYPGDEESVEKRKNDKFIVKLDVNASQGNAAYFIREVLKRWP